MGNRYRGTRRPLPGLSDDRHREATKEKSQRPWDAGSPLTAAVRGAGDGGAFGVPCSRQSAQVRFYGRAPEFSLIVPFIFGSGRSGSSAAAIGYASAECQAAGPS
jgi:hypothetical protein